MTYNGWYAMKPNPTQPNHIDWVGVLLICRGAVGVFYSPKQVGLTI